MSKKQSSKHYHSFAEAFGIQPKEKQHTEKDREKFVSRHICKVCKQPMTYIYGTNVLSCTNTSCKGIKRIAKTDEGDKVYYIPSFHTLDNDGLVDYAMKIFENGGEN